MIPPNVADAVTRVAAELFGAGAAIQRSESVGGGCINETARVVLEGGRSLFIKWNSNCPADMFEREAEGLRAMQEATSLRIPVPYAWGKSRGDRPAFLIMGDLAESAGKGKPARPFDEELGHGLAMMHRKTAPHYGSMADNYIGPTSQSNRSSASWTEFFAKERIVPMRDKLRERGILTPGQAEKLTKFAGRLDELIPEPEEGPALLHGDLWGGNVMSDGDGWPAIIDPACYYGHREADLAMTELFGGFGPRFYHAYKEAFALDPGYRDRCDIYNLYHLLNHALLFGGSYLAQTIRIIDRFV